MSSLRQFFLAPQVFGQGGLSGTIPEWLGTKSLKLLIELAGITQTNGGISGTLPMISHKLKTLGLLGDSISGTVPGSTQGRRESCSD